MDVKERGMLGTSLQGKLTSSNVGTIHQPTMTDWLAVIITLASHLQTQSCKGSGSCAKDWCAPCFISKVKYRISSPWREPEQTEPRSDKKSVLCPISPVERGKLRVPKQKFAWQIFRHSWDLSYLSLKTFCSIQICIYIQFNEQGGTFSMQINTNISIWKIRNVLLISQNDDDGQKNLCTNTSSLTNHVLSTNTDPQLSERRF